MKNTGILKEFFKTLILLMLQILRVVGASIVLYTALKSLYETISNF